VKEHARQQMYLFGAVVSLWKYLIGFKLKVQVISSNSVCA